jgi:hypothetical protein
MEAMGSKDAKIRAAEPSRDRGASELRPSEGWLLPASRESRQRPAEQNDEHHTCNPGNKAGRGEEHKTKRVRALARVVLRKALDTRAPHQQRNGSPYSHRPRSDGYGREQATHDTMMPMPPPVRQPSAHRAYQQSQRAGR